MPMKKLKLTKTEKSWILYDIGNSAFILLAATLLPIYFEKLLVRDDVVAKNLTYWSFAGSIATLLVAIIGPLCGTLADRKGYKKALFVTSMLLGAIGCLALGTAWSWLSMLILFVIAKVGFSSSLVFYDAMLPEIAPPERMDRVSSSGYAFGYIGSCIPFVICVALYALSSFHILPVSDVTALMVGCVITAIWWIVFSIPITKHYKQTAYQPRVKNAFLQTFRQLWNTVKEAKQKKHVFLYLIAFFFFIDGVYTIIDMATAYGRSLKLDDIWLVLALLVTQIVAFPFSILFGRLASKVDTGKLLKVCILSYTGITLFAIFLTQLWQFWTLAVLVGMFQGGIQALSRSYLGKIIPADESGKYYGLMDVFGKGASFVGTTMIGVILSFIGEDIDYAVLGITLKSQGIAVGSLVILFIIGFIIFCIADKLCRKQNA